MVKPSVEVSYSPREPLSDIPREDWKREVARRAQLIREAIDVDLSTALLVWKDLKKHEAWQVLGLSREDFADTHCQISCWELDEIECIVEQYEGKPNKPKNRAEAMELFKQEAFIAYDEMERAKANEKSGKPVDIVNRVTSDGNSASYLLRRLARCAPEILERYKQGEFRSARAAGIAAGIVKVKSPLEQLRSWWAKASTEEHQTFLKEITP